MEMNPFKAIASIAKSEWYNIVDFAVIAGFHLKVAGIEFSTNDDLVRLLIEMSKVGFIEIDNNNPEMVRVKEKWLVQA